MKKKVVILSSGHPPKDERIYSKIGLSLINNGYSVIICASTEELHTSDSSILFDCFNGEKLMKREKINKFFTLLSAHSPNIIISAEPLPLLAGYKYKKLNACVLISDITEWYPENVAFKYYGLKKWFSFITLYFFNIYASNLADALIIGEERKMKRYKVFAPFKTKAIISYFPILEYFPLGEFNNSKDEINLGFTGILNKSRGFFKLLNIIEQLKMKHPKVNWKLTLVGKFVTQTDEALFSDWRSSHPDMEIIFSDWLPYDDLGKKLNKVDLFLDLRELDFIFNNSLPIKIFEYMALGKPVIYSKAASIIKYFGELSFGKLVDPEKDDEIISAIEFYLFNPQKREQHGLLGRKLVEDKYQWKYCEAKLIHFLEEIKTKFPT